MKAFVCFIGKVNESDFLKVKTLKSKFDAISPFC